MSIDRSYLLRSVIFALLLLWPLAVMGRPDYMPDSGFYQNGGRKAVEFVLQKLSHPSRSDAGIGAAPTAQNGDNKTVARAITYSVLAYLLKGPGLTMIWLAAFQALCAGLTVTALWAALAGPSTRRFAVMTGVMVMGTALAPLAGFMVPDIFAGLIIGILAVLPFYWSRFSRALLVLLLLIASFAVTVHPSHPLVAVGAAVLTSMLVLMLRERAGEGSGKHHLMMLWLPALGGIALMLVMAFVGFGRVSLAPKSFPFVLARSLENGPARWYLEQQCAKDRRSYTMCELYGAKMPATVNDFLFAPGNVINRSTPEQLDRIRAEERLIVTRATIRHPWTQIFIVMRDVPRQFFHFELNYLEYDSIIVPAYGGKVAVRPVSPDAQEGRIPPAIAVLSIISIIVVALSVMALVWRWRALDFNQRGVALAILAGLLANAAVCGLLSGVTPRYQARLVWLVPFAALVFVRKPEARDIEDQARTG